MLPELIYYFSPLAGSRWRGRHRAERVLNAKVTYVRYLIGRIVKTYDYINRVVLTLPLLVYEGTWTHSPFSLLYITMILRVRRNFFEITMFPNSGTRARFYALMLYARVEHK